MNISPSPFGILTKFRNHSLGWKMTECFRYLPQFHNKGNTLIHSSPQDWEAILVVALAQLTCTACIPARQILVYYWKFYEWCNSSRYIQVWDKSLNEIVKFFWPGVCWYLHSASLLLFLTWQSKEFIQHKRWPGNMYYHKMTQKCSFHLLVTKQSALGHLLGWGNERERERERERDNIRYTWEPVLRRTHRGQSTGHFIRFSRHQ